VHLRSRRTWDHLFINSDACVNTARLHTHVPLECSWYDSDQHWWCVRFERSAPLFSVWTFLHQCMRCSHSALCSQTPMALFHSVILCSVYTVFTLTFVSTNTHGPVPLCYIMFSLHCVHTHLRVHKHPWPQVSHASRARGCVARNRSVRNRICPSDNEVSHTDTHH
jgi:hypothetical protein